MSRRSKFKGFVYDATVLIVVVGGLGLACDLGSANSVDPSGVARAHGPVLSMTTVQLTKAN